MIEIKRYPPLEEDSFDTMLRLRAVSAFVKQATTFPGTPEKVQMKYPKFKSLQTLIVPDNGNILINDLVSKDRIPLDQLELDQCLTEISTRSQREIILLEGEKLSKQLGDVLPPKEFFDRQSVAVLLPGKGAQAVRQITEEVSPGLLGLDDRVFSFPCKKVFKAGQFRGVELSLPEKFDPNPFDAFLIVDDVIATAATVQAIRKAVERKSYAGGEIEWDRSSKFPAFPNRKKPKFAAVTWLGLYPNQKPSNYQEKAASSVENVDSVSAVVCYKGSKGIPPCNSLSTLIGGDEKARVVADGLKQRYLDSTSLDQLIKLLRDFTRLSTGAEIRLTC